MVTKEIGGTVATSGTEAAKSGYRLFGKPVRVWIVDDNKDYCTTLAKAINKSDIVECDGCFHSSESVIAALSSRKDSPEVILLDIEMPGMNGLQAIVPLKSISPTIQIITLTGHDEKETIQRAVHIGSAGYLLKTSSIRAILGAVVSVTQGTMPMDHSVMQKMLSLHEPNSTPNSDVGLTKRERDIVKLTMDGLDKHEIAERLYISYDTVNTHLKNIFQKLGVHTLQALMVKARRELFA